LPFETTVDTSASFSDKFIKVTNAVKHTHGKNDDVHSHAGTAFTTWLDLRQAAAQAREAANAIAEEWPDRKDTVMTKF
ncbi:MAG: zinc ABC transporter substrate-binding protein, partial [Akkermansiaceae bacterium]|nr:zinc ABC transporter substrate-binding protein [Akkermansiaceae bacterium]